MEIVFDTYAWIEFFEGTEKGKVVKKYLESEEILTPTIVLLELSYKSIKEKWNFAAFLNFIKLNSKVVGFNEDFILSFGKDYNAIKKNSRQMGITDIIILHTAMINNAKILTGDKHFKKFKEVIML